VVPAECRSLEYFKLVNTNSKKRMLMIPIYKSCGLVESGEMFIDNGALSWVNILR
jgi:hypothetical protein